MNNVKKRWNPYFGAPAFLVICFSAPLRYVLFSTKKAPYGAVDAD
jgi:hypothetical protein